MEATFVTSPCGTRWPRTPGNVNAYEKGKGSIEKSEKIKVEVQKIDVEVKDAERELIELKSKEEVEKEKKERDEEVDWYRDKLKSMEEHMTMMEQMIEDNEKRFEHELFLEKERSESLEDRLRQDDDGRRLSALKVRELDLREKELSNVEQRAEAAAKTARECCGFESSLTISDPAVNVLCDLSMVQPLESGTKKDEKVSTVAALLDKMLLGHEQLREILEEAEKYSAKFVVERFTNRFKSLVNISKASMYVVTILVLGKINETKTMNAVKYACSRTMLQLEDDHFALKSGAVPVMDESFKLMTLTDLPGMVELQSNADPVGVEKHWRTIERFVGIVVCFISDVKGKLARAVRELEEFVGEGLDAVDDTLGQYEKLFDVCTSWFGSPYENDFKKIQRFLKICPEMVQRDYAEYVSGKLLDSAEERLDEMTMNWVQFDSLIRRVWESSVVKENIRSEFGLTDEKV